MEPKKPFDKFKWKQDDEFITIDKYTLLHETIIIDKKTGKIKATIKYVDQIPPIQRKRKQKHK